MRIIPLPSIGSKHASEAIRRVLIEVPPECPISPKDLAWAVSGQSLSTLNVIDEATGELLVDAILMPADDAGMLQHYGIGKRTRTWRSVTPIALPLHTRENLRAGSARTGFEKQVASAVANAVRHAGLPHGRVDIRVQREPFRTRGAIAQAFAAGRFSAAVLYHVELTLAQPVAGPVVIGDGRWLGLGLMAPVDDAPAAMHVFRLSGGACSISEVPIVTRAIRRALLSRAGASIETRRHLPSFFTGHQVSGAPARGEYHAHLFFLANDSDNDGLLDVVAIVAPHLADRTAQLHSAHLRQLERAVEGLRYVRAGRLGVLELTPETYADERIFGFSRVWESLTMYRPTRHPHRHRDVREALSADLRTECSRRGLPPPDVSILEVTEGPRGGLQCRARLAFDSVVRGPVVLGPGSHFGEGLFGLVITECEPPRILSIRDRQR